MVIYIYIYTYIYMLLTYQIHYIYYLRFLGRGRVAGDRCVFWLCVCVDSLGHFAPGPGCLPFLPCFCLLRGFACFVARPFPRSARCVGLAVPCCGSVCSGALLAGLAAPFLFCGLVYLSLLSKASRRRVFRPELIHVIIVRRSMATSGSSIIGDILF